MKKLLFFAALFCACRPANHDGRYVARIRGAYALTDDTLELRGQQITEHCGYRRLIDGHLQPKVYRTRQLFELQPQFEGNQLILHQTVYEKI